MHVTSSVVLSLSLVSLASIASGATTQEPYRLPPPEVVEILDAQPAPSVQLSPDGRWMFLVQRESMPSIEDVSRRMLRLAGTRIDPAANARFSTSFSTAVSVRATASPGDTPKHLALPGGAKVSSVSWSHDSTHFVITLVTDQGSQLWGGTVADLGAVQLLTDRLNTVLSGPVWMPDGVSVLCRLVPEDRGDEPAAPRAPSGPNVQTTSGEATPLRTYQDLLASPHDGALFEYYATAELAVVAVADGRTETLGRGMHMQARVSPDGRFLLVKRRTKRPI